MSIWLILVRFWRKFNLNSRWFFFWSMQCNGLVISWITMKTRRWRMPWPENFYCHNIIMMTKITEMVKMMTLRLSSTQLSCWTSTSANSPPPLLEAWALLLLLLLLKPGHCYCYCHCSSLGIVIIALMMMMIFSFDLIHVQVLFQVLQVIGNVHTKVNIVLFCTNNVYVLSYFCIKWTWKKR